MQGRVALAIEGANENVGAAKSHSSVLGVFFSNSFQLPMDLTPKLPLLNLTFVLVFFGLFVRWRNGFLLTCGV